MWNYTTYTILITLPEAQGDYQQAVILEKRKTLYNKNKNTNFVSCQGMYSVLCEDCIKGTKCNCTYNI